MILSCVRLCPLLVQEFEEGLKASCLSRYGFRDSYEIFEYTVKFLDVWDFEVISYKFSVGDASLRSRGELWKIFFCHAAFHFVEVIQLSFYLHWEPEEKQYIYEAEP
ncbi:hypothetical protein NPIL_120121 [Nephila pilipes]|uniref:Uncharacterized protein n=1 Tax=Nephila pilipes TaxID=299642 RepID=A0A8X6T9T0_NEPPI|nr:hypothetical protein NPIL_120121 [Nephila pilipes]